VSDTQCPMLILIEGLPGSGKSTLAHFLTRHLDAIGIANKWWYEEEAGHPLYIFHDAASLQRVLDTLAAGDYRPVIAAALDKWRQFSQSLQKSGIVVILDSCLFGYLTWTLFTYGVPVAAIDAYLMQVEKIIRANNPRLVYLYQNDVAAALRKICDRRGGNTEQRFIRNATESAYGKRHDRQGFDGMVALWRDYRVVTDGAFSRSILPKLAVENSAGDWPEYQRAVLQFLDIPDTQEEAETSSRNLARFVGEYHPHVGGHEASCAVLWEGDDLLLDGLPLVWPRNRLIPLSLNRFVVESLPFTVQFEEDASGAVITMTLTGRELLSGIANSVFIKKQNEETPFPHGKGVGV